MKTLITIEEVIIPILSLVNFGFILYLVTRVRQLEKRINDAEAHSVFIKDMLIEMDSKLISIDKNNEETDK